MKYKTKENHENREKEKIFNKNSLNNIKLKKKNKLKI